MTYVPSRREKQRKARVASFDSIIEHDPVAFNALQMRMFLRMLIQLDYNFLEEVATHFSNDDENTQQSDEEIVLAKLDGTADEKLTGLALRLVLSDHIGVPHQSQADLLIEAEQVFSPKKPKAPKPRPALRRRANPGAVKPSQKKEIATKSTA